MKLFKSILISLFMMTILGSEVMAQTSPPIYSQYYDFETGGWRSIPTTNGEFENVTDVTTATDSENQQYNCYNITFPKVSEIESEQDYYYLLGPSTVNGKSVNGLTFSVPEEPTDPTSLQAGPIELGDIYIVVPNNTFTLNYIGKSGGGFKNYVLKILGDDNQSLNLNVHFVPGGNGSPATLSPADVGTMNINDNLDRIIQDFDLAELIGTLENKNTNLTINSGINFAITNAGDTSDDEFDLPLTINNYAGLSIENVELLSVSNLTNSGTLSLNNNCSVQMVDGSTLTNTGTINVSGTGELLIGTKANTATKIENSNNITVLDGTLNCYGTLTNNSDAELNITADGNVTMEAGSELNNNGTINAAYTPQST